MSNPNTATKQAPAADDYVRTTLCSQCLTGYVPGDTKTFDKHCRGCLQKLKDGRRTGKEPAPSGNLRDYHRRVAHASFQQQLDHNRKMGRTRRVEYMSRLGRRYGSQ